MKLIFNMQNAMMPVDKNKLSFQSYSFLNNRVGTTTDDVKISSNSSDLTSCKSNPDTIPDKKRERKKKSISRLHHPLLRIYFTSCSFLTTLGE